MNNVTDEEIMAVDQQIADVEQQHGLPKRTSMTYLTMEARLGDMQERIDACTDTYRIASKVTVQ